MEISDTIEYLDDTGVVILTVFSFLCIWCKFKVKSLKNTLDRGKHNPVVILTTAMVSSFVPLLEQVSTDPDT